MIKSATQQIAESFEELRRATEEVGLKQEAIRQAQAEIAKMRIESLAAKAQIEVMQKTLSEFSAKSAASQLDQSRDAKAARRAQRGTREATRSLTLARTPKAMMSQLPTSKVGSWEFGSWDLTIYFAWMWIPHSSFWPCQRPERGLSGSSGSAVHGSQPMLV